DRRRPALCLSVAGVVCRQRRTVHPQDGRNAKRARKTDVSGEGQDSARLAQEAYPARENRRAGDRLSAAGRERRMARTTADQGARMSLAKQAVAHLEQVTHRYGPVAAVDNVTLEIPAQRMVGLIGP